MPTFLRDDPVSEANVQPHAGIGKKLAESLLSQLGPRVVALTGEYGSGKSTVIESFRKHASGAGHHVLIFDAWAHKGPTLQRALLQSWRASLTPRCLACGKCAQCTPGEPAFSPCSGCGRCEVYICPHTEQPGCWLNARDLARIDDALLSLSMPFRPVRPSAKDRQRVNNERAATVLVTLVLLGGVALVGSAELRTQLAKGDVLSSDGWFAVGIVMLLLVMSLALGTLLGATRLNWRFFRAEVDPAAALNPADLAKDTDPEPPQMIARSSIDAEQVFLDIARSARPPRGAHSGQAQATITQEDPKCLVIVLDNLDRLQKEGLAAVWPSIRLLVHALERDEVASSKVRVIVPLSPQTDRTLEEKIFQARFDVPPMTLLNWEALFIKKFDEAFDDVASVNANELLPMLRSWFDRRLGQKKSSPTPRELIRLINDAVAVVVGYAGKVPEDIPMSHVFYYALSRQSASQAEIHALMLSSQSNPNGQHAPQPVDPASVHLAQHLPLSMSKLIFNTPTSEDAAELTLGTAVRRAIHDTNPAEGVARLKALMASSAFWPLMDVAGTKIVCNALPNQARPVNMAARIYDAGFIEAAESKQLRRVSRAIGRQLAGSPDISLDMDLGAPGKLISLCDDDEITLSVWRELGRLSDEPRIGSTGDPNPQFRRLVEHYRAAQGHLKWLSSSSLGPSPGTLTLSNASRSETLNLLAFCADGLRDSPSAREARSLDSQWLKYFHWPASGPIFTADGLMDRLVAQPHQGAAEGQPHTEFRVSFPWRYAAMRVLFAHGIQRRWSPVRTEIVDAIKHQRLWDEQVSLLYGVLLHPAIRRELNSVGVAAIRLDGQRAIDTFDAAQQSGQAFSTVAEGMWFAWLVHACDEAEPQKKLNRLTKSKYWSLNTHGAFQSAFVDGIREYVSIFADGHWEKRFESESVLKSVIEASRKQTGGYWLRFVDILYRHECFFPGTSFLLPPRMIEERAQ
jgi:hypothetical protein